MRPPRCAEPVPIENAGHILSYAACRKETPCADHPGGRIDTIPRVVATVAKWKRDARRAERLR